MSRTSSLPNASSSTVEPDAVRGNDELKKKKKKKKRSRDDALAEDGTELREKKKKRKRTDSVDDVDAVAQALTAVQPQNEPTTSEGDPEKKKKKKKDKKNRDKGKEVTVSERPPRDPQQPESDLEMDADTQASTTALLNAIVAAVATTPPETVHEPVNQPPPQWEPEIPPAHMMPSPGPYMPFPPPSGFGGEAPFLPTIPPHIFNDLAYGSSDDVLRVLQDLDMVKLADVLKTLGDAASAVNLPAVPTFPPPPAFVPQPLLSAPTAHRQAPANSGTILGRPGRAHAPLNHPPQTNSVLDHQTHNDHTEVLCTKWMSAAKLAELVESEGLAYKKGKFSATEEQQLANAIQAHKIAHQLSDEQLQDLIFPKNEKQRNNQFWTELTRAVPQRPIIAVYHHVRRTQHPLKKQGTWTAQEDIELKRAVTDLGQQWEKVSARVGRMSTDCRDRYRNHILGREVRATGPWSTAEEEELTRIVTDMTINQGRDIDDEVFWGRVSQLMGGRRGRQQCRIKWTDSLSKIVKSGEGVKTRWSQQDAYVLVHKVDSLNVNDDTEIDWKTLPDADWNLWSAHTLQRRWLTMKKSIKGYEYMSHQEIMDILRVKKTHTPAASPQNGRKRKSRKIVSAKLISDEGASQPEVESGSSMGPGTLAHTNST